MSLGVVVDLEWLAMEKEVDSNFVGSLWQELGYEAELCPVCKVHLRDGICLNTCHLTVEARERFGRVMGALGRRSEE